MEFWLVYIKCASVLDFLKLFRTDLRISRENMAYPIKPANYSSSKEGLVD